MEEEEGRGGAMEAGGRGGIGGGTGGGSLFTFLVGGVGIIGGVGSTDIDGSVFVVEGTCPDVCNGGIIG